MSDLAKKLTHLLQKGTWGLAVIAAILVLFVGPGIARSQSGAGSIQGTVTDSTGAVITNATIHVVNPATNVAGDAKSNTVGFYQVPGLFTGTYTVTATAPNMKTYSTSIELLVAQTATINPVLSAGSVNQRVEVMADLVQLTTTDSGTVASTLESARLNQLPMNGRNVMALAGETTPGLESGGTRANGLMGEALEYVADGVSLTNRQFGGEDFGAPSATSTDGAQIPDPDAVQEVRVETSNASAQYSTPGTGIITTKSGTNSLHGALFETARNNGIGVSKVRSNLSNYAAPHLVRNEFGASAGGPIVLPHVYHGKDKSFWFFAYERYSYATNSSENMSVPTTAERTGDFSGYTNSAGQPITLYDPATTYSSGAAVCPGTGGASSQFCRTPFANNQIPLSRLSPTFKIIQDITPAPSNTNNPVVAGSNLSGVNPTFIVIPTTTFRFDHNFNENNQLYLRFSDNIQQSSTLRNFTDTTNNSPESLAADGLPAGANGSLNIVPTAMFNAAVGYTHVFSPTFFAETVVSQQWFSQFNQASVSQTANFEQKLGLPNNFGEPGFPQFGTTAGNGTGLQNDKFGFGGTQFNYGLSQIIQDVDENLTKTIGKHQMHFGGRYRHERFGDQPDYATDTTDFNGQDTALESPASNANYTAMALTGGQDADAFLGAASQYGVREEPPFVHFHDYEFDAYYQDDFRLSRNLTVNLGVRWEAHPAPWTKNNLYNSFDLKNDAMVLQEPTSALITAGYTTQAIISNMIANGAKYETPQQAGMPDKLMRDYNLNFSPRVGFAYLPFGGTHSTVIRAAYGRYIYPMPTRNYLKNVMQNNPLAASYSQSYTSSSQTVDGKSNQLIRLPQTVIMGTTGATSAANVVNTTTATAITPGTSIWSNSQSMPPDFVTQVNFTVEQAMKGNSALRVTYLYVHGSNLDHYYLYNNAPGTFVWEADTATTYPTANGNLAARPYDTTTWGANTWDVKNGWSNDNSLQVNYQRIFHRGIAYQIAYVWSKAMRFGGNYSRDGNTYPAASYLGVLGSASTVTPITTGGYPTTITAPGTLPAAPAGHLPWQEYRALDKYEGYIVDTAIPKQHITFNGIVDLPFGRSKRFLGNANRLVDELVGGWQVAGAGQVVSQDFTVTSSNWGATNPIHIYKHRYHVNDCSAGSTACHSAYLWFNGYISATAAASISGLPTGYSTVANAPTIAYESPIRPSAGDNIVNVTYPGAASPIQVAYSPSPSGAASGNPYAKTVLNGPINYNADASLFKVFPIRENVRLRFNADAFNVFNTQGEPNPNGTTGEINIQPGGVGANSYWGQRQIQLTLRLEF
jgi:hypothetical protein